jgi:glycosyltransferase involved in cell wall biosynthesis
LVEAKSSFGSGDEVVVINNNSTDQTQQVIDRFADKLPISCHFESVQGLAVARNTALKQSKRNAIVFFDDDVLITSQTLIAYKKMLKRYPEHYYFGGKISIIWPNTKPRWLKSDDLSLLNGLFGYYSLGEQNRVYDKNLNGPYGANFVLRRSILNIVGEFNERLGVSGTSIARGEETEYFKRAQDAACSGLYCADAEVGHRFQIERITIPYLFRYGIEKGRAELALSKSSRKNWIGDSLLFSLKALLQLIKGRRDRFYQCIINLGIIRGLYLATIQRGDSSV